ncbi:hypothetical protein GM418_08940 [Maribellus comscasis]|uniref:Rhodanese domain-containing protein n=1 Tax=Maribellus comscasis TaxID=2681766 RepID=A0A6I6JRE0_9BACT|nr:rhodanese-like domain-containing protein [Maribellus comscasis]QGY43779.1 hypothetical protein GM418_08940 [Maribellus comscasis]
MVQLKFISKIFLLLLMLSMFSCSGNQQKKTGEQTNLQAAPEAKVKINPDAKKLLDRLVEMGDYANSRDIPSLIDPSSVYEELDSSILIVDIRLPEIFVNGHIKNAVNVEFENLQEYFKKDIDPSAFDKIVMVCYAGQGSSYATSLLRLAGYNNVYAMRWGMSGWNKDFAEGSWLDAISSEYEDKLETTTNEKAQTGDFPQLNTGKTTGEEILQSRLDSLFAQGLSIALAYADELFEQPENYYTINYDRRDKYESGHVPGAIRYKPGGTLGIVDEMQTIPTDKQVVIYCNTGHNSGFATAYLRLFGFDAKTLTYGNNAFMHDKMVNEESTLSWLPFTEADIENYPYVEE